MLVWLLNLTAHGASGHSQFKAAKLPGWIGEAEAQTPPEDWGSAWSCTSGLIKPTEMQLLGSDLVGCCWFGKSLRRAGVCCVADLRVHHPGLQVRGVREDPGVHRLQEPPELLPSLRAGSHRADAAGPLTWSKYVSAAPAMGKLGKGQEGPWGVVPAEISELQLCS